ncbi:MAG: HD domain-containing protein, partial [Candidatus Lindowbacteria bacterium]|nr:HD domain-containing protein [Candidatus Lindowbacteria bacterium]
MNRQEALDLLNQNVKTRNLNKHMIATEACMRALAARLGEDRDEWALAGLLHDLDYDQTVNDFPRHGFVTEEILKGKGISEKIIGAIKAHTGNTPISGKMDLALFAVDPITGLIVAAGLMHPTRKLANVDVQ